MYLPGYASAARRHTHGLTYTTEQSLASNSPRSMLSSSCTIRHCGLQPSSSPYILNKRASVLDDLSKMPNMLSYQRAVRYSTVSFQQRVFTRSVGLHQTAKRIHYLAGDCHFRFLVDRSSLTWLSALNLNGSQCAALDAECTFWCSSSEVSS